MKERATILILICFAILNSYANTNNTDVTILAPPVNDEFADAITLTVNADFLCGTKTAGTVAQATASVAPNACPGSATKGTDDVWFRFVASATSHNVSLSEKMGSETNLYFSVYDGGVAGTSLGTIVLCSDPDSNTAGSLTIGNTYFVRVFTNSTLTTHTTTFKICVGTTPSQPGNDNCSTAQSIGAFPFNTSVDASSATNAGFVSATSCGAAMNDGVWYSFVGDGGTITVTVSPTAWDAKVAIFSGSCGAFVCTTFSDTGFVGNVEVATFSSTLGVTYYMNIGHPSGTSDEPEGVFGLKVASSIVLSIDDLIAKGFSYYPNPVKDELRMSADETIESISVFNIIGQQVKRITPSNVSVKLDMSDLTSGVYFIKAEIGKSVGSFKVIKQ
tara:strand:- start:19704 stop:20870 length:1167 start_codon:yes stop_codon:yes gene_type:complete